MSRFLIEIHITPRKGILDPQGKAIHRALHSLGWDAVDELRVGKVMRLELRAADADTARREAEAMCRKLLANPVTEDFDVFRVEELAP